MRWFEDNFSRTGRWIDEWIEAAHDFFRRLFERPGERIERSSGRLRDWFSERWSSICERCHEALGEMRSTDRSVPGFVWPLLILCVGASVLLTYVVTTSMSVPGPTRAELELQNSVRKRTESTRSPFDAFLSQPPDRATSGAKPKLGPGR